MAPMVPCDDHVKIHEGFLHVVRNSKELYDEKRGLEFKTPQEVASLSNEEIKRDYAKYLVKPGCQDETFLKWHRTSNDNMHSGASK